MYQQKHQTRPSIINTLFLYSATIQIKKCLHGESKNLIKQGRLDYILVSENLANVVESMSLQSGYRSDHSAVICKFKFNIFVRFMEIQ